MATTRHTTDAADFGEKDTRKDDMREATEEFVEDLNRRGQFRARERDAERVSRRAERVSRLQLPELAADSDAVPARDPSRRVSDVAG